MYLFFSQQFSKLATLCAIVLLLVLAGVTVAETRPGIAPDQALTDLVISGNKGSELQLEVREMPLAQVLDTIARKTNVPIHYSVLPEGLATATCVGATLKQILECLLARRADLIVRFERNPAKADNKEQVAEAWILGSRLDGYAPRADCVATAGATANKGSLIIGLKEHREEADSDRTDELLKMAQSTNPTERAEAIGTLLAGGRKGDPDVKALLEEALHDQDANVRAQAISSYAQREGDGAMGAIQEALHDSSVDVRMMAVDGITDDISLLQQAINDSDETVRSLAALKLEELTKEAKRSHE